jgi:pimeloyl-ACP methyl ester carboxylesterase
MNIARVRGIDLHYETHGAGSRCLLIAHGALGSVRHAAAWGLRAAEFAAHGFRVIAYDARGHGRSGYSTRPEHYRAAALADDMLGLMDALDLEVTPTGAALATLTFGEATPLTSRRLRRLWGFVAQHRE